MKTESIETNEVIDPSELFTQFNPSLYFDEPRSFCSHATIAAATTTTTTTTDPDPVKSSPWYTLIEQSVPANRTTFWDTVKRWTAEPHYAIPPIERADIISTTTTDADHIENNDDMAFETVVRQLIPRRKKKDPVLLETVQYYEHFTEDSNYEGRVTYKPNISGTAEDLPFYYPKVLAYGFTFTSTGDDAYSSGILRLQVQPEESNGSSVITDQKMRKALEAIIHKLFKWCIQARIGYKKKAHHDTLVPKDVYLDKYHEIKAKHAGVLVSTWTEKTDPKKFVYEDIAIASYLICLWMMEEQQTKRKPTFVDLGCGNGLLTYLLSKEGYDGYGVDMASRRIWEKLCDDNRKSDMLKVEALYPATVSYQADWVIGNHADELVPWVPIITTKSGDDCKFFVIPCCMYGLDGSRTLSLMNEEGGKYRAYTNYIKKIATQCGFDCEEDYLRIPSTKNIAIIGRKRRETVNRAQLDEIEAPGIGFMIRKTDREKEELRRLDNKRAKIGAN